ncbi:2-succinyl-5-enolpyruvyl-6-hydroxy-3-cyclohexene-1-carboxylate synthase [Oikeobacillus pervagus]|uniref:2-succinyl-5-enolpyruvyl-6-hydroxy-3-cyclohexene-1-carboxylate synthase n=1 Tax=Oikeobacillus pervagus TaxID=1325931 RepID=A0AAJ1T0T1_9BACI|nr:2-succinyl-5-enolpyruvyl-6-hydroxy-3-cyclohexene-1-carboxylic-acid synthase [Oikeobacillus pervagus]MDQ0216565.1 2-succinyl-5-enolpyruvyl-6-hydroxy-3-cyclohexene-1-carboxylate synthase [Oikeobacillus pervagus]
MNETRALTTYIAHFIDELVHDGVQDVVISPGSRSTPMALLMAEHPNMNVYIQIDERSAAFFALGMAKAKQKPVALLCTSGTAAANYFPAIVEAHYSRVPLIVLTADRPHELREVGAPQAINQIGLYGSHVKWFTDMALPEEDKRMIRYARTSAARSVQICTQSPKGPVHLNFPFREPLIPDYEGIFEKISQKISPITIDNGTYHLSDQWFHQFAENLNGLKRGLIICGAIESNSFAKGIVQLANKLQFPILADPLSQLRSGTHDKTMIVDSYDAFLRSEVIQAELEFDVVLRFGAMPVSKALLKFLRKHRDALHYVVDDGGGWRDPEHLVDEMITCDASDFCASLQSYLPTPAKQNDWMKKWLMVNEKAKKVMTSIHEMDDLDESKIFALLQDVLPEKSALFVGNSMPIRDIDSFFMVNDKEIKIMANRGANGIDGLVSSAIGAAVYEKKLVLVLGDLSFFHDLNGLLAAKLNKINLTILVVNNNGGGIFSYLPQSSHPKHFELLFGTPADLDFSHAAALYGGSYHKVVDWIDFHQAMKNANDHNGLSIIEIPTNREKNVVAHRQLWTNVSQEIISLLEGGTF